MVLTYVVGFRETLVKTKRNCLSRKTIMSLAPRRVINAEVCFKNIVGSVLHIWCICFVMEIIYWPNLWGSCTVTTVSWWEIISSSRLFLRCPKCWVSSSCSMAQRATLVGFCRCLTWYMSGQLKITNMFYVWRNGEFIDIWLIIVCYNYLWLEVERIARSFCTVQTLSLLDTWNLSKLHPNLQAHVAGDDRLLEMWLRNIASNNQCCTYKASCDRVE